MASNENIIQPGNEKNLNDPGSGPGNNAERITDNPVEKDKKSLKEKVKEKLQEWSNDNERDIEEDDSTPLRSGL